MNNEKEKLILENLISSKDVFSRCVSILKSEYFSPEYRVAVSFINDYYEKYHAIPSIETIKAETNLALTKKTITKDEYKYTCDSVESFCQESAMEAAIVASSIELNKKDRNMGAISEYIKKAQMVSLQKDLGIELYDNPEERLNSLKQSQIYLPTFIRGIDMHLDGGLARGQLTLFSANSGVGKSIMLANLGANYSKAGYNVLYLSLELQEPMIFLRLASIVTGVSARVWKQSITEISHKINEVAENGAGSYIIKKLPQGSTANDISSILKQYELDHDRLPDVLIVDYLDLMHPNEGTKNLSVSEQDKAKTEQLTVVLDSIKAIGLTASQQNREAIDNNAPTQKVIAGGLTKVNTTDNYMSIQMDASMRLNGQMLIHFLKTRSSDGVGKSVMLKFNPNNLIICDSDEDMPEIAPVVNSGKQKFSKKKGKSRADEILASMKNDKKPEPMPEVPLIIRQELAILTGSEYPEDTIVQKDVDIAPKDDLMSLLDTINF